MEKEIETITKHGEPNKIWGINNCKSYRSYLTKRIEQHRKKGNLDIVFILDHLLQTYNHFHPEKEMKVEVEGWKGKSTIEIIKELDKLTIIKYQRKDKESKPQETRVEVSKEELNTLIKIINLHWEMDHKPIETKTLAGSYCKILLISKTDKGRQLFEGNFWDNFYSWRRMHEKFTLILSALDELKFIKYVGGRTTLLRELTVQKVLTE